VIVVRPQDAGGAGMIEIEHLVKVFAGRGAPVHVLGDVSLSIARGEVFGVIGRSGAGKSTLVRCINALERPTSGRVIVDGQEITALSGAALRDARRRVGMIFQHFNLLSSRTVFENVSFPLELAGATSSEIRGAVLPLLDLVGLAGKRDRYPAELSGGEKQRVGIARALAPRPAVLLCDEATSALDPETTQAILALLAQINRELGLTLVLITHEMPVVRALADRVAVLDRGAVVEQGKVFDVFTRPQAAVTRAFVRDLVERELPSRLRERLARSAPGRGRPVLRVVFTGPAAQDPVIAEVSRRFDVALNIVQANVDDIQGVPYGNVVVEAAGRADAVDAAIAFIRSLDLIVEVLGHVDVDDRAAA
jgi:D-methionine transport system ATP-binding protein